jgi:hypothetical protein
MLGYIFLGEPNNSYVYPGVVVGRYRNLKPRILTIELEPGNVIAIIVTQPRIASLTGKECIIELNHWGVLSVYFVESPARRAQSYFAVKKKAINGVSH